MFKYVIPFLFISTSAFAGLEQKCYPKDEFMKLIDEEKLITVFNGDKTPTRTLEVMTSNKRHVYFVEYDSSSDGSAMKSKEYCVTQKLDNPSFNDTFIEYLHDILEKAKGQKA